MTTQIALSRVVVEQLISALEPMACAKLADGTYADKDCKITMAITAGRAALTEQAQPTKRPINCGTGHCSCIECVMEPAQGEPDIADIIAGELQISRAHAYDKMRSALASVEAQPAQEPTLPKFFVGTDVDGGVLTVSVLQRDPDGVAVLIHHEEITLQSNAERVPLTPIELIHVWQKWGKTQMLPDINQQSLMRAVEAAHGITKGQQ